MDKKQGKDGKFETCSALCPKCGSDLYIMESGCVCKNAKCGWSCNKCKAEDQP